MTIAAFQIEHVNLVERIPRLSFALKDQRLAIRGEITLAAPPAFEDELPRVGEKARFGQSIAVRSESGGVGCNQSHQRDEMQIHELGIFDGTRGRSNGKSCRGNAWAR